MIKGRERKTLSFSFFVTGKGDAVGIHSAGKAMDGRGFCF